MESQNEDQLNLFVEGLDVKKQKYNPQAEFAWADPTRIWRTINDYITYNPSILVTRKGLEVFDKMRQDDQIKAALSFKKHSILSTGWEVVSPEGEDRDWEVTEFVWYVLEHIQETFDEALFGILSAMDYGYAISEKCWSNSNIKINKSRNDYLILEALKIKKPHSFDFETDKFGNLKHLVQIQDGSKIELPLDKFVMFTYEKEFGNAYGRCFSDDTEILTYSGWKLVKDVTEHDLVATLNDKENLEYHLPIKLYKYVYKGKMLQEKGRFIDLLVTPNHKMWVQKRHQDDLNKFKYEFIEAQNLPKHVNYKRNVEWSGSSPSYFILEKMSYESTVHTKLGPKKIIKYLPEKRIKMEDWLRFIGIWLAEGSLSKKNYCINVSQKPGIKQKIIKKWVEKCGFKACSKKNGTIVFGSKQVCKYLELLGKSHTKHIPLPLKQLSPRLLQILWAAMIFGDGNMKRKKYNTVSKKLADDVAEIIFKMGYAATISTYQAKIGSSYSTSIVYSIVRNKQSIHSTATNIKQRQWLDYDGFVYCVEVPNHKIYVRRNGKACWSGNSDLEACYRPFWAKHNSYQWLVMYLERLGIPPVFALYDPNAYSPAQKTALKDIMVNMQAATFGIMPRPNRPDVKADQILDFWSPEIASQAKDVFMPALDMFNQDIARAVLMPGLIGFTPDAREGSYARSKKHFDVFMMVVEYIRRKLEKRVVMEQIIKPLVDLNYNVDSYPVFKFLPMTEEVRSDLLDRWLQAVEKGIVLPQKEDEIHIRTLLRFPEKDNDIPAPGPMRPQEKPPTQNEKVDEKPETDKKFAEDSNVSELFIRIEIDSDKKLRLIFKDMEESLIGFITKNWDLRAKWVNDLKLKYLSDMQEVLRETCRMSHSKGEMSVESLDVFAVNSLKWVTQKALLHSTSLKDSLLNACKLLILNTINSNESKDECVLKIKEIFSNLNTSMLLKSMINESYSQGVLCKAKELGSTKIKGLQYMTVQDSSTSQACSILMNKIFKLDDPDIVRFSPPNGFNCRSYWKPVFNINTLNINDYVTEQIKGIVKDKLPSKFGGSPN